MKTIRVLAADGLEGDSPSSATSSVDLGALSDSGIALEKLSNGVMATRLRNGCYNKRHTD
jgi:hypothetical protein